MKKRIYMHKNYIYYSPWQWNRSSLIDRSKGSIINLGGTQIEGHLGRASENEIEHFWGKTLNETTKYFACCKKVNVTVNRLGGPVACSPVENLKFRTEITRNVYFSIHFASL